MISYVKILGPPLKEAIRALEKIAVDMPIVCIMDIFIANSIPNFAVNDVSGSRLGSFQHNPDISAHADFTMRYFHGSDIAVNRERCENIISKSGFKLGEYDFFFEWFRDPDSDELSDFLGKIDDALMPLRCLYTLYHKKTR